MHTVLEEIKPEEGSSIRLLVNPNLSDFYFWHFHPEIELVFIAEANGIRQVGHHISKFIHGDLALIGSNIPHLNFDFGIGGSYKKSVVHFLPDFLGTAFLKTKEFEEIGALLRLSEKGIVFGESTKEKVGKRIMLLHEKSGLARLTELLYILNEMAMEKDYTLLHDKPYLHSFRKKEELRLKAVNQYLAKNYAQKISLADISEVTGLTRPAFCRYFKKMTKLTFSSFLNHYRIDIAKKLLLNGRNVTEACFESGFESISYFNRTFKRITNQNPSIFQRQFLLD
jgi:AraC-like DNA-binding protein